MSQWLKEPLFHFLVIGAGLFLLYGVTAEETQDEETRIEINTVRADRMVTLWEKRWNRPPTQEEFTGLTEQYINEEVLYREALAMGLDKDDPVVRRRMAQKVKFISNDIITIDTPSDTVLQSYLDKHASKYQLAGKVTFQHIYFNPAKHDAAMEEEAKSLLVKLSKDNHGIDMQSVGDGFMHGTTFKELKVFEINRLLGKDFSKKLFEQPTGKWVGPLVSGYGLHLVYIDAKTASKTATLEMAKQSVLEDWTTDERKKVNDAFISNLRKQYNVTIAKPTSALLPQKSSE